MKYKITKNIIFSVSLALLAIPMFFANAASISFGTETPAILSPDKNFYLDIFVDGEGEEINAFLGELTFPEDLVEVVDIYNGLTVATGWVESPNISGSSTQFSGIMAGGFSGTIDPITNTKKPGQLFRIVFKPLREGSGTIDISKAEVYKNDGLGTKLKTSSDSFSFAVSEVGGQKMSSIIIDTRGPEAFSPIITNSPNAFDGRYFLIFETTDKETGIAYYEVKEGKGPWVRAKSPYLLEDQSLKSRIRVRAVDNAGNITTAVISGLDIRYTYLLIFVLLLLFFYFVGKIKRQKDNK